MNKYTIKGVNKKTKEDVTVIVEAESKNNALAKAEIDGIIPISAKRFLDVENKKPVVVKAVVSGVFNFFEIFLIFMSSVFVAGPLYFILAVIFPSPGYNLSLFGYILVLVPVFLLLTFFKYRKNSETNKG